MGNIKLLMFFDALHEYGEEEDKHTIVSLTIVSMIGL